MMKIYPTNSLSACLVLIIAMSTGCDRQLSSIEYLERGILLAQRTHYAEAITNFNRALSIEPGNPDVFYERAVVQEQMQRSDLALKDYGEAIRLDPVFEQAYTNRGLLLASMNLFEDAIEDFSRIIELSPGSAAAFEDRAFALHELGANEQAVADLSRAIDISPSAQAFFVRGSIFASDERHEDAIVDFTEAINNDENFAKAYLSRAIALSSIGQTEEAKSDLLRATQIDSEIVSAKVLGALSRLEDKEPKVNLDLASEALKEMGWEVSRNDHDTFPLTITKADDSQLRMVCVAKRQPQDKGIELPGDCCSELLRESAPKCLLIAVESPGEERMWQFVDNWSPERGQMVSVRVRVSLEEISPEDSVTQVSLAANE